MSALHILHLIDDPGQDGSLAWIAELARHTPPEVATFDIVAYRYLPAAVLSTYELPVASAGARWDWDPIALGRLAGRLRRPWDVVHVWDEPSWRRCQVVGHRDAPLVYTAVDARSARRACLNKKTRVIAGDPTAVSRFVEEGIAREQIELMPYGISPLTATDESRETALARLDWPAATKLIVGAGPLRRSSRFDEAIWRFELLRLLHADARLAIVAAGTESHWLNRQIRLVSDPNYVRLIDDQDLGATIHSHADVYWQTSVEPAVPRALLAALVRGHAAVATDTPGHRQAISHDESGYLVDPESRSDFAYWTDRLLTDAILQQRIQETARRQTAERFDASLAAVQQCEIYRAAASGRRPHRLAGAGGLGNTSGSGC